MKTERRRWVGGREGGKERGRERRGRKRVK